MAVKLIGGTLASINAYMCFTTDPVATWPIDCGAGSKMTVIDADNKLVSSFALFDGENWSTFATSDLADVQAEIDSIKAELTGLEGGPEGFASRIDDLEAEKLDIAGGTMTGDIIFGEDEDGIDARMDEVKEEIDSIKAEIRSIKAELAAYTEVMNAGFALNGVTADDTANTLTGMAATMEFSTDEGSTWTTYDEDAPNLPDLTGELDILVRFKETAAHYAGAATEFNFTKAEGPALSGVTSDDTANTLTGMAATMEFSTDEGSTWTTYDEGTPNLPDLSGTVDILVRFKETATHYAGAATEFNFTA